LDRLVIIQAEERLYRLRSQGRDYYAAAPSNLRQKLVNTFASMLYALSLWQNPGRWTAPFISFLSALYPSEELGGLLAEATELKGEWSEGVDRAQQIATASLASSQPPQSVTPSHSFPASSAETAHQPVSESGSPGPGSSPPSFMPPFPVPQYTIPASTVHDPTILPPTTNVSAHQMLGPHALDPWSLNPSYPLPTSTSAFTQPYSCERDERDPR
jgi:hypothetical protein